MLPAERRRQIQSLLQRNGSVSVTQIKEELGVSEATVRRDFQRMEEEGLLERTRGGSLLTKRMAVEPLYSEKDALNSEAKVCIGVEAARLPSRDDTVFVNSGSTNRQVLRSLFAVGTGRVLTTNAAAILEYEGPTELIMTGGTYRPASNSFTGPGAHTWLNRTHARFAFIGVDGVSISHGLTTPTLDEAEIARLMIQQTLGSVVVVADHSKIGVVADFVSSPVAAADILITDKPLAPDVQRDFDDMDIEVRVAREHHVALEVP